MWHWLWFWLWLWISGLAATLCGSIVANESNCVVKRHRVVGRGRGQVVPPGKLVIAFVSALIVCPVAAGGSGVRGCGRGTEKVTVPRITTRGI